MCSVHLWWCSEVSICNRGHPHSSYLDIITSCLFHCHPNARSLSISGLHWRVILPSLLSHTLYLCCLLPAPSSPHPLSVFIALWSFSLCLNIYVHFYRPPSLTCSRPTPVLVSQSQTEVANWKDIPRFYFNL